MRPRAWVVFAVLAATLIAADPTQAQDPIQILDIDSYERTLAPGAQATFNWTVRNLDPVAYDIAIEASSSPELDVSVTPTLIQNLSQNRAAAVRVDVTAPSRIEAETALSLTVLFTASQDGAVVFIASRTATVTIPSIFAEKKVLGFFPNPLPGPLDNEWGVFLLDVLLWLGIALVVLLVLVPLVKRLGARTKTEVDDIIIRTIRTPLVVLLVLYGTIQSLEALDRHIPLSIRDGLFAVYQVALAVIILYVVYRLLQDVATHLGKAVAERTGRRSAEVLVGLAQKVGIVIIALAGMGLLMGFLNVDLTLFVAGGVVISMVIAFAAQDSISNFLSGIFLLTDRPFQEGDIVILSDGDWAQVRKIGLRSTRLFRFAEASLVTIPNNSLVNEKIANFTNPRDKGRHMTTFNVAYGSDPATVKRIIHEAIDATPYIIREDPLKPIVRFDAMGESSLDFFILVWIDERKNRFTVRDVLNTEVYNRLTEAGIEIPFPQRTVHLQVEGAPSEAERRVPPDVERIAKRVMESRSAAGDSTEEDGDDGSGMA